MVNNLLDKWARPTITFGTRELPSFRVCGFTGLGFAILQSLWLAEILDLSLVVMSAVILASMLTFLGLAMAVKIITGEERLTYYHHEIGVLLVTGGLLSLLRYPILPYLDLTLLGVGVFLAFGRVGCFMAGCCHGLPNQIGVCYQEEHVRSGFTPHLKGARLFPVQLVESLFVFMIVGIGVVILLQGYPAGSALLWYLSAYALLRFGLEPLRGDAERPSWIGLSESQWISGLVLFSGFIAQLTWYHMIPLWQFAAVVSLTGKLILMVVSQYRVPVRHQLISPKHIEEIAQFIERSRDLRQEADSEIPIFRTSLGILISIGQANGLYEKQYTFSAPQGLFDLSTACKFATCLVNLKHPGKETQFITSSQHVYHLLIKNEFKKPGQNRPSIPQAITSVSRNIQPGSV